MWITWWSTRLREMRSILSWFWKVEILDGRTSNHVEFWIRLVLYFPLCIHMNMQTSVDITMTTIQSVIANPTYVEQQDHFFCLHRTLSLTILVCQERHDSLRDSAQSSGLHVDLAVAPGIACRISKRKSYFGL